MEKSNRPTGGVPLYNIERDRFLPPNIYNHYYTYKIKISVKKYDQEKLENLAASLRTMVHRNLIHGLLSSVVDNRWWCNPNCF